MDHFPPDQSVPGNQSVRKIADRCRQSSEFHDSRAEIVSRFHHWHFRKKEEVAISSVLKYDHFQGFIVKFVVILLNYEACRWIMTVPTATSIASAMNACVHSTT